MSVIVTFAAIAVLLPIVILCAQVRCKFCWIDTFSPICMIGVNIASLYRVTASTRPAFPMTTLCPRRIFLEENVMGLTTTHPKGNWRDLPCLSQDLSCQSFHLRRFKETIVFTTLCLDLSGAPPCKVVSVLNSLQANPSQAARQRTSSIRE